MTNLDNNNIVADWFVRTGGGSMVLPDGWFGRPHDNIHSLTSVQSLGDVFRIELDGQLTLEFQGEIIVEVVESILIIKGFESLLFNWMEYGGSRRMHSKSYQGGAVKFISW